MTVTPCFRGVSLSAFLSYLELACLEHRKYWLCKSGKALPVLSQKFKMFDPQLHMTESYFWHDPHCTVWMLQGYGVRVLRMLQVEV